MSITVRCHGCRITLLEFTQTMMKSNGCGFKVGKDAIPTHTICEKCGTETPLSDNARQAFVNMQQRRSPLG